MNKSNLNQISSSTIYNELKWNDYDLWQWGKKGDRIKVGDPVGTKTTTTHVGLREGDKYGTFKWCPV